MYFFKKNCYLTATVLIANCFAVLITRHAISPRFAIKILSNDFGKPFFLLLLFFIIIY